EATFGKIAETCRHSSYLPTKEMWYGYCHGWVPDPGVYRTDLWQQAGYPNGPETYDDLLDGGAKIFLLDLSTNYSSASYYSKFYNFPAFPKQVPQLFQDGGWLDKDPWGSEPADKLAIFKTAEDWTVWLGYPGYANPAIREVYPP